MDKKKYFKKELASLRMMRKLNHPHLIYPLAAFTSGNSHGFLFPWAGGGNLEEFWKRTRCPLVAGHDKLLGWVLTQFCGLCSATEALHKQNCRHTDLKPQNILVFTEAGKSDILCIADVGLAKIHENDTRQRKEIKAITDAKTGTTRYEAPELGTGQLSRVFDVWCLGCVFLEFMIWTVYGWQDLHKFMRKVRQFWEDHGTDKKKVRRSHHVQDWIEKLSKDLDSSAETHSWLKECLVVVDKNMLIADWNHRDKIAEIGSKFENIRKHKAKRKSHHNPSRNRSTTPKQAPRKPN